jgi:hypothetical protein
VDGSELVFILVPIIIPLSLAIGIAAPYIADSRTNKRLSSKESSDDRNHGTRPGPSAYRPGTGRLDRQAPVHLPAAFRRRTQGAR